MAGPDMTKDGTDFSVSWDVLLEPNSKLVNLISSRSAAAALKLKI